MKAIKGSLKFILVTLSVVISASGLHGQDNQGKLIPQFLFPSFKEGTIIWKDGEKTPAILNYNMAEEMMVTEIDGEYRYSSDPHLIESIILEKRVFVPVNNAFYEILATGQVTFFLENKVIISPKGTDVGFGAHSQSVGPVRYTRFELTNVVYQYGEVAYIELPPNIEIEPASVFWVTMDDKMEKFSSKKQLLKIFPGYETKLKEYIREENINVKKREDVIKLGKYINETLYKK